MGLAVLPAPASAADASPNALAAYARARADDADGNAALAAEGYARALSAMPEDEVIAIRTYREALKSGDLPLARRAATTLTNAGVAPVDHALLLFADAVVAGDTSGTDAALATLSESPLDFMVPVLRAWIALEERGADPVALLDAAETSAFTRRYVAENRALLLLAMGWEADGVAALRGVLNNARGSADLRINAAQLLAGRGRRATAQALLVGDDPVVVGLREGLGRGAKGTTRFGVSRLFVRVADDLSVEGTEALAIALTRFALRIDPDYHRARLALAGALARAGAGPQAWTTLAAIPPKAGLTHDTQATELALLLRAGRSEEALTMAARIAAAPHAGAAAAQQHGDLLLEADRFAEAAAAYATAIEREDGTDDWTLYLQRGGALEQAGDWEQGLRMLRRAAALAPDQPAVLNYLGYAQAERGENLDEALALLQRAHAMQPDDAAITDSLGYVHYRRGDVKQALPLLERAARAEPADATIHEHLGDAYWRVGRRYEARYAWQAAAVASNEAGASRIRAKIEDGLSGASR